MNNTLSLVFASVDAAAGVADIDLLHNGMENQYFEQVAVVAATPDAEIPVFEVSDLSSTGVAGAMNLYIGSAAFNAADMNETGSLELDALPNFDDIEYTCTLNGLSKATLLSMISTKIGMAVSLAAFADFDASQADRVDAVKTYQLAAGSDFDMSVFPDFGGMAAALTGSGFNASTGLDAVSFADSNGVAKVVELDMANQMTTASVLPKILGAQIPFTGGREEILRMVVDEADFADLAKFAYKSEGSTNASGLRESLQGLIACDARAIGDSYTSSDLNAAFTAAISGRKLGHQIMAAIFRQYPATSLNTQVPGVAAPAGAIWSLTDEDYLTLIALPADLNLQFVLRTSLTLKDKDGANAITTRASPTAASDFDSGALDGRCLALFNFVFNAL
jgi:hypothetical protein